MTIQRITTRNAAKAWAPDEVTSFDPDDLVQEALIIQVGTKVGEVEGDDKNVIVPYVATDPDAGFIEEGEQIQHGLIGADQITVSTDKIGAITSLSRELMNQAGASDRIEKSLRRSITRKADNAFMANLSDPTGLLHVADVDNAGTLDGDLFAAYDAVAAIENDGGTATHMLVNPLDWAKLAKVPAATGSNQSLLANVTDPSTRSLAGVSVIVHAAVTQGTALMLDSNDVLTVYGPIMVDRSDSALFAYDAVAVRATWRIGWDIVRPARLRTLTVA